MTVKDLLYLSWLSYIDMPDKFIDIMARGESVPVKSLAAYAMRTQNVKEAEYLLNSDAKIIGYINDNGYSGFAAYIYEMEGKTVIAMRGSESMGERAPTNVDWLDNVCAPFSGSAQYDDIRKLTKEYGDGEVIFTGHSKGGHNALYALSVSDNPLSSAIAFNGQGFSASALTKFQIDNLKSRAVNYVTDSDIVGALLSHPENRIFVKSASGVNPHMPEAFVFDTDGAPVLSRRKPRSYIAEAATKFADMSISGSNRSGVSNVCKSILNSFAATT